MSWRGKRRGHVIPEWTEFSFYGRPIQPDRYLRAILGEAYYTLLPHDRHPIVALHVEVPASSVDVSGHPAKTRVRFRDPAFVGRQIALALHATLLDAAPARWQRRASSAPRQDLTPSFGPN